MTMHPPIFHHLLLACRPQGAVRTLAKRIVREDAAVRGALMQKHIRHALYHRRLPRFNNYRPDEGN